jgi:AraC family transcriptional activator of mtrCDE
MKLAASMLRGGASMPDAAELVGYHSESAFAQAFKRVTGVQPGVWRRGAVKPAATREPALAALH